MIIFGTRSLTSSIKSGNFYCPQCDQDKPFRHRKVTKYFSLYFIPLIPYGSAGEYIECASCKGTFIPEILESTDSINADFRVNYEKAIRHSMVMIMLADGIIDENEKEHVLNIINSYEKDEGKKPMSMNDFEEYIDIVAKENQDLSRYLKKVAPTLNESGKKSVIKNALSVAAADGKIDDTELEAIYKMGQSMEMSSSHLKGIISEFSQT